MTKNDSKNEYLFNILGFCRSYFFSVDFVRELFIENGFVEIETTYVNRRTVNKKEGIDVPRIFVQAKFRKVIC